MIKVNCPNSCPMSCPSADVNSKNQSPTLETPPVEKQKRQVPNVRTACRKHTSEDE